MKKKDKRSQKHEQPVMDGEVYDRICAKVQWIKHPVVQEAMRIAMTVDALFDQQQIGNRRAKLKLTVSWLLIRGVEADNVTERLGGSNSKGTRIGIRSDSLGAGQNTSLRPARPENLG